MMQISLSRDMIHTGNLILVNREYPCKESGAKAGAKAALTPIGILDDTVVLERQHAAIFIKLMNDLSAWGHITATSGWRSQQEQEQIYQNSLLENGADFTAKYVALPGHSEHQTGLALDLALRQPDIDTLRPYFPYTGICGVFRDRAERFGFIERYPKNKENITGIAHEPWHFRYVGAPHATIMNHAGETLEEYLTRLKEFPYGCKALEYDFGASRIEVSYLAANGKPVTFEIENDAVYTVSGNNMDGFIITVWQENR